MGECEGVWGVSRGSRPPPTAEGVERTRVRSVGSVRMYHV